MFSGNNCKSHSIHTTQPDTILLSQKIIYPHSDTPKYLDSVDKYSTPLEMDTMTRCGLLSTRRVMSTQPKGRRQCCFRAGRPRHQFTAAANRGCADAPGKSGGPRSRIGQQGPAPEGVQTRARGGHCILPRFRQWCSSATPPVGSIWSTREHSCLGLGSQSNHQ